MIALWLSIILSALLFSLSFVFSQCAFAVLFFLPPLYYFFIQRRGHLFGYGFLWGSVAFGIYFIWLFYLVMTKTCASWWLALLLYLIIVLYASLSSGVWFWITGKVFSKNFITLAISAILYFFFLDRYLFCLFGTRYPFLNPLLPLMQYKWVTWMLFAILGGRGEPPRVDFMPNHKKVSMTIAGKKYLFSYLPPCKKEGSIQGALEIQEHIRKMNLRTIEKEYDQICIVGPETTYRNPLNKHADYLELWSMDTPSNVTIMLGSLREDSPSTRKKIYQTVYQISGRLIINHYDKKHRVVFVEKVPDLWKRFAGLRSLFMQDGLPVSKGRREVRFKCGDLMIEPFICSELFFFNREESMFSSLGIVFVNDSWFCPYFRHLLYCSTMWRSIFMKKQILYVGHEKT